MDQIVLKDEIVDKIKEDPILFGKVGAALELKPSTMPRLLQNNDPRLTQANVLKVISEHMGIQDTEELLQMQVLENKI